MKVLKEVIRPGEYWYLDSEGKPRCLKATPEKIKHWFESGNAMRAAGLSIPVPVEHQLSAKPQTPAERAASQLLNNAGWVDGYVMRGERLYAVTDIQDESLAAKLPKTVRYTSPWIHSFTDGNGKKWDEVITHLALTSRPRITAQEPFKTPDAALSLATPADTVPPGGLFLSRAGLLDHRPNEKPAPHYPMAFSVWSGVSLADDFPPKKEKVADDKPPPKKEGGDPEKPDTKKEGDVFGDPDDSEEMDLCTVLKDLVSALWGIDLPDDTTEDNLMQRMLKAMMDHLKSENGVTDPEHPEPNPQKPEPNATKPPPQRGTPTGPVVQEDAPMYMSHEQVAAITDPVHKKTAEAVLSLQAQHEAEKKRSDALAKNILDGARRKRNERIQKIAARVKRDGYEQELLKLSEGVALSLGDDGAVADPMLATLDVIEKSIVDVPALLAGGGVAVTEHPADTGSGMSEERRRAVVDEFERSGGLKKQPAAA